ncbi:MAG: ferredoxin:thioredoxin reductase [candidate division WOR-3 bacterium]|nr:MAG: ferredoxin:thioredoxin reductase [candidate division WOR-3 bacterium]
MRSRWDSVAGTTEYNKNLARIVKMAQDNGYVLNPDVERLRKVIGLMTMNKMEFGNYYCPCKHIHPLNPRSDTLCPCPEMNDEIHKDGHCFCKLFYKVKGV